jgi:hypothetical protein
MRRYGRTRPISFEDLWKLLESVGHDGGTGVIEPDEIEVLSWIPGDDKPRFMPVSAMTRRAYIGEMVDVATDAGHRLRCTADHPFVVLGDGDSQKLARDLSEHDLLPAIASPPPELSVARNRSTAVVAAPATPEKLEALAVRPTKVRSTIRSKWAEDVYSLEIPTSETFVTSGGLIVHNCFPKDVSALKQLAGNTGYHFQLLTAVIEVNELQKRRTVSKLKKHLGSLVGKEIALLGVAFKPNTDDIREATSLVLAGRLQGEGANVRAYDPVAGKRAAAVLGAGVKICDSAEEALEGAHGAVLVTEWPEFGELDWINHVKTLMKKPLIVDGRNFLDREALTDAGFTYEGVGR